MPAASATSCTLKACTPRSRITWISASRIVLRVRSVCRSRRLMSYTMTLRHSICQVDEVRASASMGPVSMTGHLLEVDADLARRLREDPDLVVRLTTRHSMPIGLGGGVPGDLPGLLDAALL